MIVISMFDSARKGTFRRLAPMGEPRASIRPQWWAHFDFTRINIAPIILRKKIEDVREAGASKANRQ
jgi:hypothetical protein